MFLPKYRFDMEWCSVLCVDDSPELLVENNHVYSVAYMGQGVMKLSPGWRWARYFFLSEKSRVEEVFNNYIIIIINFGLRHLQLLHYSISLGELCMS